MPMTTAYKNLVMDAIARGQAIPQVTHVGAHTLDPGETGTNEVTGGSPAYARKPITHGNPASGGSISATTQPALDIPPSTTVRYLSLWTAVTGGVVAYTHDVPDEVFNNQGTYTVTSSTIGLG